MRVGFLLLGGEDIEWNSAIQCVATELQSHDVRVDIVKTERIDPLLQSALCYRMLQLDYNIIAVRPEKPDNLVKCIRTANSPKPIIDLGAVIPATLMEGISWYHRLPNPPDTKRIMKIVNEILSLK